jgi:hypothetical protein
MALWLAWRAARAGNNRHMAKYSTRRCTLPAYVNCSNLGENYERHTPKKTRVIVIETQTWQVDILKPTAILRQAEEIAGRALPELRDQGNQEDIALPVAPEMVEDDFSRFNPEWDMDSAQSHAFHVVSVIPRGLSAWQGGD